MTANRVQDFLVKAALAIGFIVAFLGVRKIGIPNYSPEIWDGFPSHIFFILIFGIFSAALVAATRFAMGPIAWIGACLLAILGGALGPFAALVFILSAFFCLGQIALSYLKKTESANSTVSVVLVGAGIYGFVISIAAQFAVNYVAVYGLALAIPIAIRWRDLVALIENVRTNLRTDEHVSKNLVGLATVAVGLFYFAVAMMPEVGFDALAIHLFVPARMAHDHLWAFDPDKYVWALMPMLGDWIFSIGYMLAGETCTRMLNVVFIFFICSLIRETAVWLGADRKESAWASLLFLTTPLAFTEAASLFIESVWTAFALAGVLYICRASDKNSRPSTEVVIAGLLLGAAVATKAVTFMILPATFVIFLFAIRRVPIRSLAIGFSAFLLGTVPYIKSFLVSGNPTFPFYNNIFKSRFYLPVRFEPPPMFTKGVSWDVLHRITFESASYLESRDGAAGFAWLLLLVPVLIATAFAKNRRAWILFFVAFASVLLTFHSTAYLRYVFPSFAMFAALLALAFSLVAKSVPKFPRLVPALATIAVIFNVIFLNSSTLNGELNIAALTGADGRANYLQVHNPVRNAVETLNGLNLDGTPVAIFATPASAGLKSDAYYFNWYNFRFSQNVNEAQTASDMAKLLVERGIDYVLYDESFGTPDVKKKVIESTDTIWATGALSIRVVKSAYRFDKELMANPEFKDSSAWSKAAKPYVEMPGAIAVTADSPAFQVAKVESKHRYRQTVVVQCTQKNAPGRLQVNWIDAGAKLIRSDSRAFDCTAEPTTHTMEAVSPTGTETAIVFAVATSEAPVTFRKVSLSR